MMFFSPRIRVKPLAELCHRLAVSTGAGLDDRRIWRSEAERSRGAMGAAAAALRDGVERGDSISLALRRTGDFFPPLFCQIVSVGDATGRLEYTYRRLAQHYDQLEAARRRLRGAMAWPLFQFGMAVLVVALLIILTATLRLRDLNGQPLDMLGFGLQGVGGLSILVGVVLAGAMAVTWFIEALRRGAAGTRTLLATLSQIPLVGEPLTTLAVAQFTWAMQLVVDTPMDLRKALPLALDATGNDRFSRLGPQVARRIEAGATIRDALAETHAFPADVLEAISIGEQTGMLPETMQRLARDYQDRAARAIRALAQTLGYIVWLLVAGLIILLIFRIANVYLSPIRQLTDPNFRL